MKDGKTNAAATTIAKQSYLWEIKYSLKYFEVNVNQNIIIRKCWDFDKQNNIFVPKYCYIYEILGMEDIEIEKRNRILTWVELAPEPATFKLLPS